MTPSHTYATKDIVVYVSFFLCRRLLRVGAFRRWKFVTAILALGPPAPQIARPV